MNGDPGTAAVTLRDAIDKACAAGDFRAAAVARVRLGRVLRAAGDRASARAITSSAKEWYDGFGGGEGALLAETSLAALDAEEGKDDAVQRLVIALEHARGANDHEVEVLALDALARCHAAAGELDQARAFLARADDMIPAAAHLVFDSDRIDARGARGLIEDAHPARALSTPN